VEVLESELLLWLSPSKLLVLWLLPLDLTEHWWHLESWHLHLRGLELWDLWHSGFHFLHLLLGGLLKLFLVVMDFLFELFSGDMVEFFWVPSLLKTMDHHAGGGKILDNVGDLLDSLLISGALVVIHHEGKELVGNSDEIHTVLLNSLPDFAVLHEAGVKIVQAPVLPDITNFLELASLVVLVDTIDDEVNGLLHFVGGDLVIVFTPLASSVQDIFESWLHPVTEALFVNWIILLVVHTSDRLDIGFLHGLSGDFMEWEEFFIWDLAVFRLVEDMGLLSWVVMDMK